MEMKDVYSAIESGEKIENSKEINDFLKSVVTARNDAEAEARTLKAEAEQYSDIDIAKLKSDSAILEKLGTVDEIKKWKAQAEGFEENESKVQQLTDEIDAIKAEKAKESEDFQMKLTESNMRAELTPLFTDAFVSPLALQTAMADGLVVKTGAGICYKQGDEVTLLSSGGLDKLKEHPAYKPLIKTPSGGDIGGGANGGDTGGNNKPQSLADSLSGQWK